MQHDYRVQKVMETTQTDMSNGIIDSPRQFEIENNCCLSPQNRTAALLNDSRNLSAVGVWQKTMSHKPADPRSGSYLESAEPDANGRKCFF